MQKRSPEELFNTLTHLAGVVFTLALAWIILRMGYRATWQHAFGVTFFTVGMLLMFAFSTLYHWWMPGRGKRCLRLFDHIGIYVMIAASYTPICVGVVGGAVGWTVFSLLWAAVLGGVCFKVFVPPGRYPRLSLLLYLVMGWSVVFIAEPVYQRMPLSALCGILSEGFFYTSGTYFFVHDDRPWFHGLWHLFVLLGAISHWAAVLLVLQS
ncbi:MAG: hemolysin III family protein [Bacteroidales bacterium]|nr:hemolysin III family protein [Bacteroidales bacterium]